MTRCRCPVPAPSGSLPEVDALALASGLRRERFLVVDLRSFKAWEEGHIPGAVHRSSLLPGWRLLPAFLLRVGVLWRLRRLMHRHAGVTLVFCGEACCHAASTTAADSGGMDAAANGDGAVSPHSGCPCIARTCLELALRVDEERAAALCGGMRAWHDAGLAVCRGAAPGTPAPGCTGAG